MQLHLLLTGKRPAYLLYPRPITVQSLCEAAVSGKRLFLSRFDLLLLLLLDTSYSQLLTMTGRRLSGDREC
ncbi:hypothetical protein DPMN_146513 [Dreissena polymorpha]|uniref:Uncharacterized protein n=1 Tax=Dreissena polymorpha TaxID=45954 RepID=A0A9D4IYH2_DREPO|nr:hypothetical protein DPMN_146513 [Dreissena polymorpha]